MTTTERGARYREVLDAAQRTIIAEGLEATTLRKIAVEGGFTTGVVMHHFPGRDAVISATFAAMSDDWVDQVEERIEAATSIAEQFGILVNHALPCDPERQKVWRMWIELFSYAGRNDDIAKMMISTDVRWERCVAEVVARCKDAGMLTSPDPEITAYALTRLTDGLALRSWVSGDWSGQRSRLVETLPLLGFAQEVIDAVKGVS